MTFSQPLQGGQRRGHFQVVGIRLRVLRHLLHHERTDTSAVEVVDVSVAVVALGMQGKEQRFLGETQ